ncbi:hypothetical protein P0Y35_02770 [Kiritimatiellaeota bacterium B1221]|nr:hypothetical protein [Kiritimatiellaeota bacterium B1221]
MASKRKKIFIALFLLLVFPILLVGIAVQPFFIKSVILPKVEDATESRIEVGDLKLSLWKSLVLSDVSFAKNDGSLQAEIPSVQIQYNLIQMIKGTIWVDEVSIREPAIIFRAASTTLAPTQTEAARNTEKAPPQFHIRNVKIENGRFSFQQDDQVFQLQALNFELPELINGQVLRPHISTRLTGYRTAQPEVPLWEGNLESRVEMMLSDQQLPTELKGFLTANLSQNEAGIPPMTLKIDADLGLDPEAKIISFRTLSAEALQDTSPLLNLNLLQPTQVDLGQTPPVFTDTELTLNLPVVNIETLPFAEWIPLNSGKAGLNSQVKITGSGKELMAQLDFDLADISYPMTDDAAPLQLQKAKGKGNLTWSQGGKAKFDLELAAEGLKLSDSKSIPSPLNLHATGKASVRGADIQQIDFSWSETKGFQNRVTAKGTADWQNPKALDVELQITGDHLDLNPWADWMTAAQSAPADASSTNVEPKPVKSEKIQLTELPFKNFNFTFLVHHLRLNKIRLDNIQANVLAGKTRFQIKPLSLTVNGSTFTNVVDAQWENLPLTLGFTSSLSPLDIEPIVDSLLPEKSGAVTGILAGSTRFQITGSTSRELWDSFKGQVEMSYTEGKIRLIDPDPDQHTGLLHTRKLVQDIITALANALQLSPEQLMAPEIESVVFKTQIRDQQLSLEQAKIVNPEFMLEAKGSLSLSTEIAASKIENLPLVLGLNTNLAKRVKIYREDRVINDYVVLPSFIEVSGSLETPKIEVKKGVITGLIISGVTERNKVGNENVQTGLEVLGSILSGEPIPVTPPIPAPTPQPGVKATPTPKPGKTERILEGIQIFNQLRATPTPVNP